MLYRPGVCISAMPYVPHTVPAYAVRDPAYTAEVFALTLVEIDTRQEFYLQEIFVLYTYTLYSLSGYLENNVDNNKK